MGTTPTHGYWLTIVSDRIYKVIKNKIPPGVSQQKVGKAISSCRFVLELPIHNGDTPEDGNSTKKIFATTQAQNQQVRANESASPVQLTAFAHSDMYRRYMGFYITVKCILPFAMLLAANSALVWNLWLVDLPAAVQNRRKVTNSLVFIFIYRLGCLMPDGFLSIFYGGAYIDAPNNIKVSEAQTPATTTP